LVLSNWLWIYIMLKFWWWHGSEVRLHLKCYGTRAETRFCLSVKRTSPFKSAGASVQSTNGSRGVRISGNNAGYTIFRGSVKSTGYPLHLPVSPLLPLLCVTLCHHISNGLCVKQWAVRTCSSCAVCKMVWNTRHRLGSQIVDTPCSLQCVWYIVTASLIIIE
jgi:hypothetical protein